MEHRVTTLEVQVNQLSVSQAEILKELKLVNEQLARYKGAWGAVVMIAGAVMAAGALALKYVGK